MEVGMSAKHVGLHILGSERGPHSRRPFPLQTPTPDVRPKTRGRDHAGATPAARIACTRFRAFRCRRPHIFGPERGSLHAFLFSSLLNGAPVPDVLALLALSGDPAPGILHAPDPEWRSQCRNPHTPGSEWGFRFGCPHTLGPDWGSRTRNPHTPGPEWGFSFRHPPCPWPRVVLPIRKSSHSWL